MKIDKINLRNYKRFSNATICLNDAGLTNILIGANNSGKTSFIEGVTKFLTPNRSLRIYDFPIEGWDKFNTQFNEILTEEDFEKCEDKIEKILDNLPSLKVTISYDAHELHIVKFFLPSLQNKGNKISFTVRYEPKNMQELLDDYCGYSGKINKKNEEWRYDYTGAQGSFNLEADSIVEHYWENSFQGFLKEEDNLKKYFAFKVYISNPYSNEASEEYPFNQETLINPLFVNELIKVSTISAGRYLSDTDDTGQSINLDIENKERKSLISRLLTTYAHTREEKLSKASGIDYLDLNINLLKGNYETERQLKSLYAERLSGLLEGFKDWGYPGIHNPNLGIQPKVDIFGSLEQEASILLGTTEDSDALLPENYNGLGYRNLLYIYLQLNLFKQEFSALKENNESYFHLILIEEPEANLHSPVQRVFIEQVDKMFNGKDTQVVVSTHSNHIVDSVKFEQLHYFKVDGKESEVVYLDKLSLTTGNVGYNNDRFIKKYFELHSHDIFFADGIIIVEGESEEILIPNFIRNKQKYEKLNQKYISMMRVGGAYAHKFIPLLKVMNKPTLIITDIDSANSKGEKYYVDLTDEEQLTTNAALKDFFQLSKEEKHIKKLIEYGEDEKEKDNIRITYQSKNYGCKENPIYARTFEDAFALRNKKEIKEIDFKVDFNVQGRGLLTKFNKIFDEKEEKSYASELFDAITSDQKSDLALDIIYYLTFNDGKNATDIFELPTYIEQGLEWLNDKLTGDKSLGALKLE